MPVDPAYDSAIGSAQHGLTTGLLGAGYRRAQLGQTYGLGQRADGTVFDDVSNPYSLAAEQQKAHDRAVRGTQTSMAAQGQLYSGAFQNAQNANAQTALRNRDSLVRSFQAAQQDISNDEQGILGEHFGATAGAEAERIARALQNRPLAAQVASGAESVPAPAPPATAAGRPAAAAKPVSAAMKKRVKARMLRNRPANTRSPGRHRG